MKSIGNDEKEPRYLCKSMVIVILKLQSCSSFVVVAGCQFRRRVVVSGGRRFPPPFFLSKNGVRRYVVGQNTLSNQCPTILQQ